MMKQNLVILVLVHQTANTQRFAGITGSFRWYLPAGASRSGQEAATPPTCPGIAIQPLNNTNIATGGTSSRWPVSGETGPPDVPEKPDSLY